jgi:hypothetical protein
MSLLESLVGVFPMVSAGGFPSGAPVIADFDRGDGSVPAKPLGALRVEGKSPIPAEIPAWNQILRIKQEFLHMRRNPKLPNPKRQRRTGCPMQLADNSSR